MSTKLYVGPLHQSVSQTATDLWNDSCSVADLEYSLESGCVGATTNPNIVLNVLQREMHLWKDRIEEIIRDHPTWPEDKLTWKVIEEIAINGANILLPVFTREDGLKGRISIQTNPTYYRSPDLLVEQAIYFSTLAKNIQVKIPVSTAGIKAIEEATYAGVNINATVCFSVPQAIAAAEAVERGLRRRESEGKSIEKMRPVCTIMLGRLDEWLQYRAKKDSIVLNPSYCYWAGIACFKKLYKIFQERGYRVRLLAAAFRQHLHWSELIGGDIILTIPCDWQKLFNSSDIDPKVRINDPVDPEIINELYRKFADFRRSYDEDGMSIEEFDQYGPNRVMLHFFIESYYELLGVIRQFMMPKP
jgi:transaldolase